MSIRITAIRQTGGNGHEHISHLWWAESATAKVGSNSRAEVVSWIEDDNGHAYVTDSRGDQIAVGVVVPTRGYKYLRTLADGIWTNNLLALPRK